MKEKSVLKKSMNSVRGFFSEALGTDEMFAENEVLANRLTGVVILIFGVLILITLILSELRIFLGDLVSTRILCVGELLLFIPTLILTWKTKGRGKYMKLLLMGILILCLAVNDAILTYSVVLGMAIPVVISIRYYNRKFTVMTAVFTGIVYAVSQWIGTFAGMLDINHVGLPAGTLLTVETTIEEALLKMGFDTAMYREGVMLRGYVPKLMVFLMISVIAVEVAYRGYKMVVDRNRIAKEHGRIDAELNVARTIQEQALPEIGELRDHPSYDLAATMEPAKEVGGDFFDYLPLDDTHLALMIADVSGKGIPAAMFMMVSKLLLDNGISVDESPAAVLEEVNHALCEKNLEDLFVTVWLGIIDLETGMVRAANAGHEYPILCRAGGSFEKYKDPHGLVLACMDGMKYKEYELQLSPGDTLFLYTDGVTDARNEEGRFFGLENTCDALNKLSGTYSMSEMLHALRSEIASFSGAALQYDDITMLGFRLNELIGRKSLEVTPDEASLETVRGFLNDEMDAHGVSAGDKSRMDIAVDEIYSNIVRYSGADRARVGISVEEEKIGIEFRDNGIPFDPLSEEEPDVTALAADEEAIGGLGIYLTKQLMDEVSYRHEDGENVSEVGYTRKKS